MFFEDFDNKYETNTDKRLPTWIDGIVGNLHLEKKYCIVNGEVEILDNYVNL